MENFVGPTGRQIAIAVYVLAMVALVVGLDVRFFRHRLLQRLVVNVGVVLMFGTFYLTVLKRLPLFKSQ